MTKQTAYSLAVLLLLWVVFVFIMVFTVQLALTYLGVGLSAWQTLVVIVAVKMLLP